MKKINKNLFPRSPLRFPGSKSRVIKKLAPYFKIEHNEYREPFVGGGAIFFGKSLCSNNWLNDKDTNITTFLEIIRDRPNSLCDLIRNITPSVQLWSYYRTLEISENPLYRAFRFFFFNRTNYSGIYNASPIGGMMQKSEWTIDCRWNAEMLCKRIIACSEKLKKVQKITSYDYKEVINSPGDKVFLMLDPPYYEKGSKLYPISMQPKEHEELAELLKNTKHKFLLTIDDCEEVRKIYKWADPISESWYYTINSNKKDNVGRELFITNISKTDLEVAEKGYENKLMLS